MDLYAKVTGTAQRLGDSNLKRCDKRGKKKLGKRLSSDLKKYYQIKSSKMQ
jgi:hypothetical protein